MKVNFSIKPSKADKDGNCLILLDFYVNGERTIISSGEKCPPGAKTWNGRRIIGKVNFREQINSRLDAHELKLQNIETDALRNNIKLTPDYVKAKFKEKQIDLATQKNEVAIVETQNDLFLLFKKFIEDSKNGKRKTKNGKKITKGTIKTYEQVLSTLKNFSENKQYYLSFKTINEEFYNAFCDYCLIDLNHYDNNLGKLIKTLKTFFTWSEKTKEHTRTYFRGLQEEKDIVVFTPEQLNLLIDTNINLESVTETYNKNNWTIEKETILETVKMLQKTKDIFILGCTTTLRVSDLLSLTKDQNLLIANNYKLKVYPQKGGKEVLIDLPPFAEEIINKYLDTYSTLLPPMVHQNFNENLKTLGKYMGLDKIKTPITRSKRFEKITTVVTMSSLLSSHVMRRTGITTLLIAGMNEYAVRKISGHSKNSKAFTKYIEFSQQFINQEYQNAWENIRNRGYGNAFMKKVN